MQVESGIPTAAKSALPVALRIVKVDGSWRKPQVSRRRAADVRKAAIRTGTLAARTEVIHAATLGMAAPGTGPGLRICGATVRLVWHGQCWK
jgi:hypothetical protein